jgi:hypothetical protein
VGVFLDVDDAAADDLNMVFCERGANRHKEWEEIGSRGRTQEEEA